MNEITHDIITRDIINNEIENLFPNIDNLLDRIVYGQNTTCHILQYVNQTVLIYDTITDYYLSWYKLTHIGRAYHTNLESKTQLRMFLECLKYYIEL